MLDMEADARRVGTARRGDPRMAPGEAGPGPRGPERIRTRGHHAPLRPGGWIFQHAGRGRPEARNHTPARGGDRGPGGREIAKPRIAAGLVGWTAITGRGREIHAWQAGAD